MTADTLLADYLRLGFLQFGRFEDDKGKFHPLTFQLRLLPSYPAVHQATAKALLPLLGSGYDRLLATRETVGLGALLSVLSGLPLVYPYGESKSYTQAFVIEGAYDLGHPTILLTYVLNAEANQTAQGVGLNVRKVVGLFSLGQKVQGALRAQGLDVAVLFDLPQVLAGLTDLPQALRQTVLAWLAAEQF
jgi:orotate phosphoribosyltransferase